MDSVVERATGVGRRGVVAAIVTALVVALVLGAWRVSNDDTATPRVVEGWAMPNADGTKIGLYESADHDSGDGYSIAGAMWADPAGGWRQWGDGPTCIGTDTSSKTHVELHVITVQSDELGEQSRAVAFRCLE